MGGIIIIIVILIIMGLMIIVSRPTMETVTPFRSSDNQVRISNDKIKISETEYSSNEL